MHNNDDDDDNDDDDVWDFAWSPVFGDARWDAPERFDGGDIDVAFKFRPLLLSSN